MTTVQIVGIAVAAAVVLILIIILVALRHRESKEASDKPAPTKARGSFLDDAPQDTFAGLGRAEQPVEDVTIDPGAGSDLWPASSLLAPTRRGQEADPAPDAAEGTRGGLGLDWGPPSTTPEVAPWAAAPGPTRPSAAAEPSAPTVPSAPSEPTAPAEPAASTDDGETTEDLGTPPAAEPATQRNITESGTPAGAREPARPAEGGSAAAQAAPESGPRIRRVPLSDIIVTTSDKVVDLADPEVRKMLTDLVKFEIDQATSYQLQGQVLDAVLQLTEAEKISKALGMRDAADAIHKMVQDLKGHV
jgi:hypothetical protein